MTDFAQHMHNICPTWIRYPRLQLISCRQNCLAYLMNQTSKDKVRTAYNSIYLNLMSWSTLRWYMNVTAKVVLGQFGS